MRYGMNHRTAYLGLAFFCYWGLDEESKQSEIPMSAGILDSSISKTLKEKRWSDKVQTAFQCANGRIFPVCLHLANMDAYAQETGIVEMDGTTFTTSRICGNEFFLRRILREEPVPSDLEEFVRRVYTNTKAEQRNRERH